MTHGGFRAKPFVVVRLMGGLGNQLFQVALGTRIAVRSGATLVLDGRSLGGTHDGIGVLAYRSAAPQFPPRGRHTQAARCLRGGHAVSLMSRAWALRVRSRLGNTTVLPDTQTAMQYLSSRQWQTAVTLEGFYQDLPIELIDAFSDSGMPVLRRPTQWYENRKACVD